MKIRPRILPTVYNFCNDYIRVPFPNVSSSVVLMPDVPNKRTARVSLALSARRPEQTVLNDGHDIRDTLLFVDDDNLDYYDGGLKRRKAHEHREPSQTSR